MKAHVCALAIALALANSNASCQTVPMSKDALTKCADAGVAECQFKLGQLVENGNGVARDRETAKKLYEMAYKNGYDPAGAALLQLTRSDSSVAKEPTPWRVDASPSRSEQSPRQLDPSPAQAEIGPSPKTWPVTGSKGAAPVFDGLALGDSEEKFQTKFPGSLCQDKETRPTTRSCEIKLSDNLLSVSGDFLQGKLINLTVGSTVEPSECDPWKERLASIMGKSNHPFASHFLSAFFPGDGKYWSGKDWGVVTACVNSRGQPSDLLFMVLSNDATKVKD